MYLVAGLGITGQSVLRYCQAQGEVCFAFDTRTGLDTQSLASEFPDIAFAVGEVPIEWYTQFDTIVLSPGIAKSSPWVVALIKLGKEVIGDIELFARAVGKPVIAITGSNGKSTVATLTGLALSQAGYTVGVGGNIGQAALTLLLDDTEYDVYVLELSSFQLETTYSLVTASATVLNISEDHMDRYDELEDYIQAKTKVFAETELAVIPADFSEQGLIHHAPVCRFSLAEGFIQSELDYGVIEGHDSSNHLSNNQTWLGFGQTRLVSVSDMALKGSHHALNALAMMALCRPFKVTSKHFTQVLASFTGLPHRTQSIGCFNGVDWVNDSKGTNVGATVTAIESIGSQQAGSVILIAGGVGKEADFSDLKQPVATYCRQVILFGRDQAHIAESLTGLSVECVETLDEAVDIANKLAHSGDCVLFSPACASFDQFDNYLHRGDCFKTLVEAAQLGTASAQGSVS
ncbi:MAG: UDP-N-acetylmuramoyl-L-alanine--D-glutamate ligase [Gammaproteobacteria bacterium]|nr:UDP-N-acetylmuramoyl-L-alanine--D-glutamate ligase [Gammaproteobacteria bacterium]